MNVKKLITKKRIIWAVIILVILVGGYFLFFNKKVETETLTVHPGEFLQQVSASGNVVAKQDLNLSFEQSGVVSYVNVKVGNKVGTGQLLASQNTAQLSAQLAQMQAGINLEQARLDQLLAGASAEDIQTAKDSVVLAEQAIDNAYAGALASLQSAYTTMSAAYNTVAYIQLTYFYGNEPEGIQVQNSKNNMQMALADAKTYVNGTQATQAEKDTAILHIINDINTVYNSLVTIRQVCETGIYYSRVLATDKTSLDTQKTNINTALTTITSSQSTIASGKITLLQAQSALTLKKSPARTSDIAVYQAQIDQAKASAQNVLAQLQKQRIYSPINGVVSAVNAKVGSVSSAGNAAISVISANDFQIESYVPEINISLIKPGNKAIMTLDAYGPDTFFETGVVSIDPAQTLKDGVSTYKVTLVFMNNSDERIKSGMTGNIIITTMEKQNIISVPQGIIEIKDGKKTVKVQEGETVVEKIVETGSVGSNGNIEVVSGLQDRDVVIIK